jgi:hypothetical protein
MTDPYDKNAQCGVFDRRDDAVVRDAVLPELAEFRSFQRRTDASRIIECGNAFGQEPDDAPCGSCPSLSSSFVAAGSKSIRQAMRLHHVTKRHRRGATGADVRQTLFGEIDVLQIIDVFEDRFSRIERLGTPCREGERLKTSFNVFWESDGKHGKLHRLLYTYSLA